ncbi:MAG: alpha/beta fold hydrolase [Alphaproteobacteria bacterium]
MSNKVILIHGLGLSTSMWDVFVPAIESWGFDVLTYNLPGHGGDAPVKRSHDLQLYVEQALAQMDKIGWDCAHLVGFSLGGMINRKLALLEPHRTASLSIWNSPHDRGEHQQAAVEDRARNSRQYGVDSTLEAALDRWLTAEATDDLRNQVRSWRRSCDPGSYAEAAWVLANGVPELVNAEPTKQVPTQVITCENDVGSTPDMARKIAMALKAETVEIIPGLKHLGLLQRPDLFLDPLKKFLSS